MANPTPLFEVDASQILAKLHLAGLQPVALQSNQFIVNTAIKNDNPKADPNNPGKVTFDLSNASGEYFVGFVTEIKYSDKTSGENSDVLKDLARLQHVIQSSSNSTNDPITKKIDKKKTKELAAAKNELKKLYDDNKEMFDQAIKTIRDFDITNDQEITPDTIEKLHTAVKNTLAQQSTNSKDVKITPRAVEITNAFGNAVAQLKTYMVNFAGPDKGDKIDDNCAVLPISNSVTDSNSSGLITSTFSIAERSEVETEKITAAAQSGEVVTEKICFAISYGIELNR